ncbi:MAG: hypothetical protein ABSD20_18275 [Terriglobales bacterium]
MIRTVLLLCVLSSPLWLMCMFLTAPRDYPYYSSMVTVPILAAGCIAGLSVKWRHDKYLKLVLGTAAIVRIAAAGLLIWIGAVVYGASVDSFHYWSRGLQIARQFQASGWDAFTPPYWNSWLIANICGLYTVMVGNELPSLMVLFALAALWGSYFFYRAFCLTFPMGNRHLYAALVFLLPSIVFWSSSIGKDALGQLFIGITAFGFARVSQRPTVRGGLISAVGVAGALLVRPHVGAMLALSITFAYIFGRAPRGRLRTTTKFLLIPLVLAGAFFIAKTATGFLGTDLDDSKSNINRIDMATKDSQIGESAFNRGQPLAVRVLEAPLLLFRPFPWEVHGVMAAFAGLEGAILLLFAWNRRRLLRSFVRDWRQPFVGFVLVYALIFCIVFSAATSNFGIVVRQRIMLTPLVLMLCCGRPQIGKGSARRRPKWRILASVPDGLERSGAYRQFLPRPVPQARIAWNLPHFPSRDRFQS